MDYISAHQDEFVGGAEEREAQVWGANGDEDDFEVAEDFDPGALRT